MSEAPKHPKWDRHTLPATLSICPPGVRMVAVQVWADRKDDGTWDDDDTEIYPVLALVAKEGHNYQRRYDEHNRPPKAGPNHEKMESLGWRYDDTTLDFDVIIDHHQDYGICEASFALGECGNAEHKIVSAPWPPDEDKTRLADLIEKLRRHVRLRAEVREQSES
jgi:hypothetical protein